MCHANVLDWRGDLMFGGLTGFGGLLVAIAIGIWGVVMLLKARSRNIPRQVLEFVISPPPGTIFAPPIGRQTFAISPDGTRLAFTVTGPNGNHLDTSGYESLRRWTCGLCPVPKARGTYSVAG